MRQQIIDLAKYLTIHTQVNDFMMTSPAVFTEQWLKNILKAINSWSLISVLTIFFPYTKTF